MSTMVCWHCHWGWSKKVQDIFDQAMKRLDGDERAMLFGPGHIVWCDENFTHESIRFCIEACMAPAEDVTQQERDVVRWSLEELLKLKPEELDPCPKNYDGRHPKNYPPTTGVEMAHPRGSPAATS